jgi:hypothetical protein
LCATTSSVDVDRLVLPMNGQALTMTRVPLTLASRRLARLATMPAGSGQYSGLNSASPNPFQWQ